MSKESLFTTVRIADLRLILGLLFVTVGVSAVIFAFLDYHSMVGNRLPSLNPVSDLKTDISAIPPGAVLAQKCARPGIVKCLSFDSPSDLHYTWPAATVCDTVFKGQKNQYFGRNRQGWGNTVAAVQNGQCVFPEIDAETVHSGAGSLKITIPSNSSADSGGQFMEVFKRDGDGSPDGTYVGPGSPLGSVLYFQFYQRFDDSFLSTDFRCLDGECGGWKQAIWFGNPPKGNSASSLEVTITNGWQRGVPQMYGQIGRDDYGMFAAASTTEVRIMRAAASNRMSIIPSPYVSRTKRITGWNLPAVLRFGVKAMNPPAAFNCGWMDSSLLITAMPGSIGQELLATVLGNSFFRLTTHKKTIPNSIPPVMSGMTI